MSLQAAEQWRLAAEASKAEAEAARKEAEEWRQAAESWRAQAGGGDYSEGNSRPVSAMDGSCIPEEGSELIEGGSSRRGSTRGQQRRGEKKQDHLASRGSSRPSTDRRGQGPAADPVSIEEVASAVEKRTEALISAAVQDVLLTVQQIVNPLNSKINRCERTTKKISTLQRWGGVLNSAMGQGDGEEAPSPEAADGGEGEDSMTPKPRKEERNIDNTLDTIERKLTMQDSATAELKKQVKHVMTLVNPLQAQVGKLDDHLARSQVRLAKIEALAPMAEAIDEAEKAAEAAGMAPPEPVEGEEEDEEGFSNAKQKALEAAAEAMENFKVVDQVSNLLATNVEPLTMRLHALETFLLPLAGRVSTIEDAAFREEIGEEEQWGGDETKVTAAVLFRSRMTTMENLLGPLHERLMMQESQCRAATRAADKAKLFVKESNHNSAKLEQLESKLTQLVVQPQEAPALKPAAPKPTIVPAESTGADSAEVDSTGAEPVEPRVFKDVSDVAAHFESQFARMRQDLVANKLALEDLLDTKLAATKVELIKETHLQDGNPSVVDVDGGTRIEVKVRPPATQNGREWAMGKWDGFITSLCDLHNGPWQELASQLGIYDTLMVFRERNLDAEAGSDTTLLEAQFIDHLEQALRTKADSKVVKDIEGGFKELQQDIIKVKEKLANSEMDGKMLDQIEDRVAEMIQAAAPEEQDIIDRIELLFKTKMVDRDELEETLAQRLGEIEEHIGANTDFRTGFHDSKIEGKQGREGGRGGRDQSPGQRSRDNSPSRHVGKNKMAQRDQVTRDARDMQALSTKADRRELLSAIESVEKQVPGAQDRLATALAARAHCYQTLRCLSCDQTTAPPATAPGHGVPSSLVPKGNKRTERQVNLKSLMEQQELDHSPEPQRRFSQTQALPSGPARGSPGAGGPSPTQFLHLLPRSHTAGGTGIVGVNTPRSKSAMLSPMDNLPEEAPGGEDGMIDLNMSLGLHVRSLPKLSPEKQWSPEVARELRKGFNC